MNLPSAVQFQNHTLQVHARNGKPWLSSGDIGTALGYGVRQGAVNLTDPPCTKSPADEVNRLYARNADEFTDEMTAIIRLPTGRGIQDVRVFSPRGCQLIGFFARTDRAKAFRAWVLDVLEGIGQTEQVSAPALPHSLHHRADAVVSASRTFNALLRSGRAAGMSPGKCLNVALQKSYELTGIDLRAVLDLAPPPLQSPVDRWQGRENLRRATPKADEAIAWAEGRGVFCLDDLIEQVYGDEYLGLRSAVGRLLKSFGYSQRRTRKHGHRSGPEHIKVVYHPPIDKGNMH